MKRKPLLFRRTDVVAGAQPQKCFERQLVTKWHEHPLSPSSSSHHHNMYEPKPCRVILTSLEPPLPTMRPAPLPDDFAGLWARSEPIVGHQLSGPMRSLVPLWRAFA
jgi:hypothetical protein